MKKLSPSLLAQIVSSKRKELNMTQKQLSDMTGINRAQQARTAGLSSPDSTA